MSEPEDSERGGQDQGHARLGELCRRLATAPRSLDLNEGTRRLVDDITSGILSGRHPDELDDSFDALEESLLASGHSAGLGSYRTSPVPVYRQLPGSAQRHPLLYVLACPGGRCPRLEAPDPDSDSGEPTCTIFDRPLRQVGLRRP